MNILIVDDVLENRKLLGEILESFGECDLVENGQSALELFAGMLSEEGHSYDLVLLDIAMPVMDGQEALKSMRQIEADHVIPEEEQSVIIMVTAVDATNEVNEAFQEGGCTDYINKPISQGKLLSKLSEHKLIAADWWKDA